MKYYKMPEKLRECLLNYIAAKPLNEVFNLWNEIQALVELPEVPEVPEILRKAKTDA